MCGIAGIHRRGDTKIKTVDAFVDRLLLAIEHRGGDSTGLLSMLDNGETTIAKTTEKAAKFITNRRKVSRAARTVLLHTRFATKGAVIARNAHPVKAGNTAAIHNGMISNDDALFAEYGMKRTAEVDSIAIPAIIDHFGWHKAEKAIGKLRGGAAIAVVNSDHPDELILARTRSYPLHVLVTKDLVVWASERTAIESAWIATYGTKPRGEWIMLPEWTMLRVNGSVTKIPLPIPKIEFGKRSWAPTPRAKKRKAGTKTTPKMAAPAARRAKPKPTAQLSLPVEHEPYMDDAVRDLMRWADCDYEDAYEAVFGTLPPETDDDYFAAIERDLVDRCASLTGDYEWIDDLLVPLDESDSDYRARRRAEGWEVGL
jgi:predicted glutamine amidotransferase